MLPVLFTNGCLQLMNPGVKLQVLLCIGAHRGVEVFFLAVLVGQEDVQLLLAAVRVIQFESETGILLLQLLVASSGLVEFLLKVVGQFLGDMLGPFQRGEAGTERLHFGLKEPLASLCLRYL